MRSVMGKRSRLSAVPLAASVVTFTVGMLVLVGWQWDIEFLKRISPTLVAMNPATAIAFLLAASSLWLHHRHFNHSDRRDERRSRLPYLAGGIGCAVALVGLLKLAGFFLAWESGIDEVLFSAQLAVSEQNIPNRMAPNTAANFLLLGTALVLLARRNGRNGVPQVAALAAGSLAWLALIGYAYGARSFYGITSYIPMALHTATVFLLLSMGIICLRPDRGVAGIINNPGSGGQIARRILPVVIVLQPLLGWIRLIGERRGLYEAETGVALMVMVSIVISTVIILATAASLNRSDDERRRAEEEITRLNASLKSRASELEQANRELESFSYSVSHDLRAPLRHIAGFVDLLRKDSGDSLKEKSRRYLGIIASSAQQMGCLIDDLLEFSRTGRVKLQQTAVDLNKLVDETIAGLATETGGRKISWKKGDLPKTDADPALMRQVFVNLLSNAIKYTATRDSAEVEIGHQTAPGEMVVFVRDNGIGFDMQFAGKLFGVFQRLHNSDEFEGTGIGLATVRRIVQKHGGRTWAEGALDRGATFYFSIPLAN